MPVQLPSRGGAGNFKGRDTEVSQWVADAVTWIPSGNIRVLIRFASSLQGFF